MISKIKNILLFNFFFTSEEKRIKTFFKYSELTTNTDEYLLVALIDDVSIMKLNFKIANIIAKEKKLKIKYFFIHTKIDSKHVYNNIFSKKLSWLFEWNYFSTNKLRKKYNIKKGDLIFSNYINNIKVKYESNPFLKKDEVLNLKINKIQIGDLVYDTYLRFRAKPTLELEDSSFNDILNYSICLFDKWNNFFNLIKINTILVPYSSYIHWGIPCRIALSKGVPVITYGSNFYIISSLNKKYQFHSKNFHFYKSIFKKLNNQDQRLNYAKISLDNRLNGDIDLGTSYMKNSAYSNSESSNLNLKSNQRWCIVFLHCFFDSPHIYGQGLFSDFYEWINYILEIASLNKNIIYLIKEHPNGLPENKSIIETLQKKYLNSDNIKFIPSKVSNKEIINLNPNAVFTYYGTVAHEFAYLGFPVITAGDNPHMNYEFIYNPSSLDDFKYYIINVGKYGLPKKYLKSDIEEFYYMHYNYFSESLNSNDFLFKKDFQNGEFQIPENLPIEKMLYENI